MFGCREEEPKDPLGAVFQEESGTFVGSGTGGYDIVDEDYILSSNSCKKLPSEGETVPDIPEALGPAELRLMLGHANLPEEIPEYIPLLFRNSPSENLRVVISPFEMREKMERNGGDDSIPIRVLQTKEVETLQELR